MKSKQIKFVATNKDMLDIWPHPKPAVQMIPDEYKKLKRFNNNNYHEATVKTCMPFLDSMTAGYIIPFDQDYVVDPVDNDFSIFPANKEQDDVSFHPQVQLPQSWSKKTGKNAGKFMNKWLITTPSGYSCLFTQPMNRYKEDRFKIIEGIVDTDSYINIINFPFLLNKWDEQFIIKKGEPMVQVVPFKRESWKMWSGFYYEPRHRKTILNLMSEWVDRYKKMYWHKKSFK